jgi:hypothetical protein
MFPCRELILSCRFPMYMAFPCSEYYQQVRLPLQLPFVCGWSIRLTYSVFPKTVAGLPGSVTLPFPSCHALRPRRSLRFSRHYRESTIAFQVFDLVGLRLKCYEAQSLHLHYGLISLCLRLARVVTFTYPRLDFRWSGFSPFLCRNFTDWKCPAYPGAPKKPFISASTM